ncbi:MAG: glycosyltransferase family 4 protein [Syntrophobacteraceae bacterium]
MKIAFYCPNKPLSHPHPSGDLIIARDILRALNRMGHDCKEMAEFRSRWFWTSPEGWIRAGKGVLQAGKIALSFRPDLWLTYHTYYKSPDVLGPLISRLANIPYVLFQPMYGTRWSKDSKTRAGFYLNRFALKASHHAFINNLDDMEALQRVLPLDKITYLPPGIFPEEFIKDLKGGQRIRRRYGIPEDMPLLMSAARLRDDVKFESISYLINSLTLFKSGTERFMLLIVGDGPMEPKLRRLAQDNLPGRVIFCGRVAREEMANYYSAADIFVFPGIGESLGMVFIEAQACGLPVVALENSGVLQVVSKNKTGLLVHKDDGKAMAEAVSTLLENHDMRRQLGSSGPKFIQTEHNLHASYLRLSAMLQHIIDFKP